MEDHDTYTKLELSNWLKLVISYFVYALKERAQVAIHLEISLL